MPSYLTLARALRSRLTHVSNLPSLANLLSLLLPVLPQHSGSMQATPRHKLLKHTKNLGSIVANNTNNHVPFTNLAPQTPSEHYWASRALKAEALLTAREKHYEEIGRVREEEELKRNKELQVLESRYKERYSNLEKLVAVLFATILLLLAFLIHLTTSHTPQNVGLFNVVGTTIGSFLRQPFGILSGSDHRDSSTNSASWLNLHFHLPSHFTIPILSPWTSVIERQTSNITNTSTSSGFSKYLIPVSIFIAFAIPVIIFLNAYYTQDTPTNGKIGPQRSYERANSIREALGIFLSPRLLSSLAFWRWTWRWGYRVLHLLGLVPR